MFEVYDHHVTLSPLTWSHVISGIFFIPGWCAVVFTAPDWIHITASYPVFDALVYSQELNYREEESHFSIFLSQFVIISNKDVAFSNHHMDASSTDASNITETFNKIYVLPAGKNYATTIITK